MKKICKYCILIDIISFSKEANPSMAVPALPQ